MHRQLNTSLEMELTKAATRLNCHCRQDLEQHKFIAMTASQHCMSQVCSLIQTDGSTGSTGAQANTGQHFFCTKLVAACLCQHSFTDVEAESKRICGPLKPNLHQSQ